MTNNFVVRGIDKNGNEAFYTGRAGDGWLTTSDLHTSPAEAFTYATLEGARNKATSLNRMSDIHGWRFVGIPSQPAPATTAA